MGLPFHSSWRNLTEHSWDCSGSTSISTCWKEQAPLLSLHALLWDHPLPAKLGGTRGGDGAENPVTLVEVLALVSTIRAQLNPVQYLRQTHPIWSICFLHPTSFIKVSASPSNFEQITLKSSVLSKSKTDLLVSSIPRSFKFWKSRAGQKWRDPPTHEAWFKVSMLFPHKLLLNPF